MLGITNQFIYSICPLSSIKTTLYFSVPTNAQGPSEQNVLESADNASTPETDGTSNGENNLQPYSTTANNKVCLFCKQSQKKVKRRVEKLKQLVCSDSILKIAKVLHDDDMLAQISNSESPGSLYYHSQCKLSYHSSAAKFTSNQSELLMKWWNF